MAQIKNSEEGLPQTSRSLPIVLIRARESIMAPIRKMLNASNITEQQWRILRVLSESGPIDSSTLADRASIPFPSLTRIAFAMNEKGLLLQRRNEKDRRRQIISITDKGQAIIDENLPRATEIAHQFRKRLGDEDYEKLIDLLIALDETESG